jgi:hypothetical protein
MNDSVLPSRGPVVTLGVPRDPKPFVRFSNSGFREGTAVGLRGQRKAVCEEECCCEKAGCGFDRGRVSAFEVVIANVVMMRDSVIKAGFAAVFGYVVWREWRFCCASLHCEIRE